METPSFLIHTRELGPMENFVYLIEDRSSRRAAVVDPAWEVGEILELATARGLTITDILLTHSHHDHVNGVDGVLAQCDAELHLLKDEARFWGAELARPTLHYGGDRITLGRTEIGVLHTPGHTPGSACYSLPGHLITGDTLFVFGCGRCDLRGGDPEAMYRTLNDLQNGLPGTTILHPGHHYAHAETSTLSEQREGNPFLHFDDVASFVHYRMHVHDRTRDTPYGPVSRRIVNPAR